MKKGLLAVLSMVAGATAGVMVSVATVGKEQDQTIKKNQQLADKHLAIMKVYDEWLKVKQDGGSLVQYFMARGYKILPYME